MTTPTRSRPVVPFVSAAVGVVLLAFLVVLVMAKPGGSESASSPLLGRPAPVVQSTTIDNQAFDLSRRKGSWVVFNFFNSTCVPCRQEHPLLLQFAEEQQRSSNPVEMYTIINDDSDAAVRAYFQTYKGNWPKIRDSDGSISVAFGVAKVPETWVIDPDGFVRLRIIGALSEGFLSEQIDLLKRQYAGEA
jgi:cytochrome c biogenesis protein CcmG, thiol:disulfide interchange protein DsbE